MFQFWPSDVDFHVLFWFFCLDAASDTASVILPSPIQKKNYYKAISENKEIIKLVSVLSTTISSTKRVSKSIGVKVGVQKLSRM